MVLTRTARAAKGHGFGFVGRRNMRVWGVAFHLAGTTGVRSWVAVSLGTEAFLGAVLPGTQPFSIVTLS